MLLKRMCHYHAAALRLSEQLNALGEEAARMPGGGNQQPPTEDMSGLVDGLMHQLLAKDVLYQPIQEIGSRYPQWLEQHRLSALMHSFGMLTQCVSIATDSYVASCFC